MGTAQLGLDERSLLLFLFFFYSLFSSFSFFPSFIALLYVQDIDVRLYTIYIIQEWRQL